MLSSANLERFDALKRRYPETKALTLPLLWMIQEEYGFISEESMKYAAGLLGVPYGHVLGVVTFYTMFRSKPAGKYHIEVCTNVSCMLRGSGEIMSHLEGKLGIKCGETTKDRRYSLGEVECMGACGKAPMFAVGETYYENLDTRKVDKILDELR
ncbi:MAG TPA: NAD(P)H-dependent oxidoreductase subunit E [Bacteroidota bacterium]|nr:NAD(P)H-dependent oxidoreductase subunit E [Bacteroidota bacterium]